MPEIGRIQSTNFQSLLTELGITRNNIPFGLQSEVLPVVLVGGTVSFLAAPTPPYRVQDIFTAGVQVAPAANFVLADTGPLLVGAYSVDSWVQLGEGNTFVFEWRDAANAANLWTMQFSLAGPAGTYFNINSFQRRLEIANDNERFRILNLTAGTAGISYQASILART